jgi:hypothetical protein
MAYLRLSNSDGQGDTYLRVAIDGMSSSSHYHMQIYNVTTGQSKVTSDLGGSAGAYFSTAQTFTGLSADTIYNFYAEIQAVSGGATTYVPASGYTSFATSAPPPPPDTPPNVSINSWSGENAITAGWSASDDHGIRSSNSYYVEISGENNTTFGNGYYTNSTSATFQFDRLGSPFVVNSVYTVRVTAYDTIGQATPTTRAITYTKTKPTVFNWDNAKTSGGQHNLTSSEWDRLIKKVNEWREYKGKVTRNLIDSGVSVSSSIIILPSASNMQSVINALTESGMNNSTSINFSPSSGGIISASHLNNLRDVLNSIT